MHQTYEWLTVNLEQAVITKIKMHIDTLKPHDIDDK